MTKIPGKKEKIFLTEYKESFDEIKNLVDNFEGLCESTQANFVNARERILNTHLNAVQWQKNELLLEIRRFLSVVNGEIKALNESESYFRQQLAECTKMKVEIAAAEDENTDEKAAV